MRIYKVPNFYVCRPLSAAIVALPALLHTPAGAMPDQSSSPESIQNTNKNDLPPASLGQPLLLVQPESLPTVSVFWTDQSGEEHIHSGSRPYRVDAERTPLGGNISAYAAVGGTRLIKGAGHPNGAVIRTGFYKVDNAKPFFDNVSAQTEITVVYKGIRFNQPVDVRPDSIVQHLKYDRGDMQACGLPGDAREQFNMTSESDTLNDRVQPGIDTRLGILAGNSNAKGSASLTVEEDGSVTMTVVFEYPVLRNLRDPWKSDLPGTFLEPYHFHVEFEAVPEGTPALQRERIKRPSEEQRAD